MRLLLAHKKTPRSLTLSGVRVPHDWESTLSDIAQTLKLDILTLETRR
jgi:hypothetical protein